MDDGGERSWPEPRRGCTKSAARPLEDKVSPNNVEPAGGFTSASGSGSRSTAGHRKPGPVVWLRQFEPGSNSADANRLLDRRESHEIAQNRSFRTVSGANDGRSVPDRSVPANAHGSESVRAAGPAGVQPRRGPGAGDRQRDHQVCHPCRAWARLVRSRCVRSRRA